MLEAQAHLHLKSLLRHEDASWPHHLTLSRLVGRSLRRRDTTLLRMAPTNGERWWLGLLIPLCLSTNKAVLVLSDQQRRRLLQIELPRLQKQGFQLPCWEGSTPPKSDQLWLLNTDELVQVQRENLLGKRQLLIPDMDQLSRRLRHSMTIKISTDHWEQLRRAHPQAAKSLLNLHERISRKLFEEATGPVSRLDISSVQELINLLQVLDHSPTPWSRLLENDPRQWSSWAQLDHDHLLWDWFLVPLEPLELQVDLLSQRPILMLSTTGETTRLEIELAEAKVNLDVIAALREQELTEPLALFAPKRQPLPNTEIFAEHLLNQSRRLILGRNNLTVVLLDDDDLRLGLTSALAAEFGRRVIDESTAPDSNGVISASWNWWLHHHEQLPLPEQLIVGLLPIASLSCPLTAARVARLKLKGKDWFRTQLLPEALSLIPAAVAPLRRSGGRLAILDGRIRGRGWGDQVLKKLEPWVPLHNLLPD